jgi:hypothetical protein
MPPERRAPVRAARVVLAGLALAALRAADVPPAAACDVCAVYTASEMRELRTGFHLGVAEQLTRFATIRDDGHEVANPGERLTSSIAQVLLGWDPSERVGLLLSLPIVSRTFRRLEDGRLRRGDETGVADLSLLGRVLAYRAATTDSVLRVSLLGGLELPSGDTSRLGEELAEAQVAGARVGHRARRLRPLHGLPPARPEVDGQHAALASGIHGHDLALGSGSVDGIVGASAFASWQRLFATAETQYAVRTEGDFAYRYANDLTWSAGPGAYALLTHAYSLGGQVLFTGETKGNDHQAGVKLDDTAITALYLGPGVSFSWGTALAGDVVVDVPVLQHTTGRQIVADVRLRGGITWRF